MLSYPAFPSKTLNYFVSHSGENLCFNYLIQQPLTTSNSASSAFKKAYTSLNQVVKFEDHFDQNSYDKCDGAQRANASGLKDSLMPKHPPLILGTTS